MTGFWLFLPSFLSYKSEGWRDLNSCIYSTAKAFSLMSSFSLVKGGTFFLLQVLLWGYTGCDFNPGKVVGKGFNTSQSLPWHIEEKFHEV
jgi:hypothetical protein